MPIFHTHNNHSFYCSVTAGDLGINAAEVEKTLGSILDLCSTWDALVLIDEADLFLEKRTSTEIERNALVCVMLRLLEYYSGCLFLSSNRKASSIGKYHELVAFDCSYAYFILSSISLSTLHEKIPRSVHELP